MSFAAAGGYKDPQTPVEKRIDDLISKMTLEEKIDMIGGTGFGTKPNARLGIPELKMTDGPVGVRWGTSTAFPAAIMLASTWDTTLAGTVRMGNFAGGKSQRIAMSFSDRALTSTGFRKEEEILKATARIHI